MKTYNTYYSGLDDLSVFINEHFEELFNNDPMVLVQVFSGLCEEEILYKLTNEITGLVPHAQIVGTTTSGEIMNGIVSGIKIVLSFTIFQQTNIRNAIVTKDKQSDYELGRIIASQLNSEQAKLLILFATGLTINANELLRGVQAVNSTVPVAGGLAGDNSIMKQCFVFNNNEATDCGVVGVVLEGESLNVSCYWHLGWQPIGKEMTITKADDLRIYTIDNLPAYTAYQKYLGLDDIGNFLNAVEYPLMVMRHGIKIARIPHVRYDDDSLGLLANITEGEKVRFSYGHVGTILNKIDNLCKQIRSKSVESIYVYTCTSRRGFLQEHSQIETSPLQEIAPTAGFFTYGEFFHSEGKIELLNATMTVVTLAEIDDHVQSAQEPSKIKRFKSLSNTNTDNVAARNIGVLKTLSHLVNTVTAELVDANKKLQYISLHDALTGLYNRAYFEQEMRKFDNYHGSVGIIVCDIDSLKLVNDILGHDFGDNIIRLAAERLIKACRPDDIVARIGGDEYVILLPDSSVDLLEDICNRISNAANDSNNKSLEELLYLSVGFGLKGRSGEDTMSDAFKIADRSMYRKKLSNSSTIQRSIIERITHIESKVEARPNDAGNIISQNIIQREWAETEVRREMERTSFLLAVSAKLNANSSYDEVLDIICKEGAKAINASGAYLHIYDNNSHELKLKAYHGLADFACTLPNSLDRFDVNGITVEYDVIRVRLADKKNLMGVLSIILDDYFCLGDNDRALISGIAELAAVHLIKAGLWNDNQNQLEAIKALFNNAQRLAHSLDMSNIAQDVCRTCVESFDAQLTWLGKAEEDGSIRVIGTYPDTDYPYKITVRWDDSPAGRGPAGAAFRSGSPIFINDIRKDPRFDPWREFALGYGVESVAGFPLISKGKAFGVLMVYGRKIDYFNQEKKYYIEAYAHQAAAALQNAKLFEESERRAACLQSLREIDIAITNNLDLSITLNTVLDQVISQLSVDAADILLTNGDRDVLTYVAGKGFKSAVFDQQSCCFDKKQEELERRKSVILAQENFTHYLAIPIISKEKYQGLLELYHSKDFPQDKEWLTFLDMLVNQTVIAIDHFQLFHGLKRSNAEQLAVYDATIEGWSRILDLRDKETEGHSQRVTHMTLRLAAALGIKDSELIHFRRGALLHDIGKMGIPDSILLKPGPLDDDEWEIMKRHPEYAYQMLSPIDYLHPALDIPYAHHERWDGSGYPRGLKGEQIPLAARIFALVDVYDALSSDRPYRKAWNSNQIVDHIRASSGSHFDPKVVDLFIETFLR